MKTYKQFSENMGANFAVMDDGFQKSTIKKIHHKADDMDKDSFRDKYGKEKGDQVRYAVATNIVKKKMGIKESAEVMKGVNTYLDIARDKVKNHPNFANLYKDYKKDYAISVGPKYIKIYDVERGQRRAIHAFVNKSNGDLLKPAGFNAPAKGARGNVLNFNFMQMLKKRFDVHGGHLYRRPY